MDTQTVIVAILSSSFLAAIITSLASGLFSLKLKQRDYLQDYHKIILNKRIEAHEAVETLIITLKGSTVSTDDSLPFHLIFAYGEEKFYELISCLYISINRGMWLDSALMENLTKLNYLLLRLPHNGDIEVFGKKYYSEIAVLRKIIETNYANSLQGLHKIDKFLKNKIREKHSFNEVRLDG